MSNIELTGLMINQKPGPSAFKRKSKSVVVPTGQCSAFGTSCRKISKFDVADPLNCSLQTPGPGNYMIPDQFQSKPSKTLHNFDKLIDQYNTQKYFENSSSPKVKFIRKSKEVPENLNATHLTQPKVSFTKVTAERGLWDSNNYYHPYKYAEKSNPGPGNYEKHYEPIKAVESYAIFKSQSPRFQELLHRGIGPGSYSVDVPKKLPDCENFMALEERKTRLEVEPHVRIVPAPGTYTPYVPGNSHCSTYVFNSASKRGCQVMPKETVGPGGYNIDKSEKKPVTFPEADRLVFDYFKGKPGVGPAHYVNVEKHNSRQCSFEYYSERFFPTDKKGIFLIPEAENEKNEVIVERKGFSKKYVKGFNRGEERFNKVHDVWVKKKVAPDPGHYDVKEQKNLGFGANKAERFQSRNNDFPGPGSYTVSTSPLKPVQDTGFYKST